MSSHPIADLALLSDCRSAALVRRDGTVCWLSFPRFDSPSVFGSLLDDEAGHWTVRPANGGESTRRYVDGAMVLETVFRTSTGEVEVTDAMALAKNERGHRLGANAAGALLRRVRGRAGEVEMLLELAPCPEYGLIRPLLRPADGGIAIRGGADVLFLSSPVGLEVRGSTASARFVVREGDEIAFALQHRRTWEPPPEPWTARQVTGRLDDTVEAWGKWSAEHQAYEGPWRELVYRSGSVLQALTYQPTGAIVAAPTTSLPEAVGGERNWDYRYAWVRDASLTMEALWVAACPDEAEDFFGWMAGAVASDVRIGGGLQVMFGVGGERDLTERDLPHLSGWRGSRPVRVGNGAWVQRQLDVYGELLGAAHRLADQIGKFDPATCGLLVDAADAAMASWTEPDQGIWEVRGEPRHFLYSKLMCWVALDRAIALADRLGAPDRVPDWEAGRDEIRRAIEERGWSERAGAFTQSFDSDELDAAALMIPIVGMLPGDDPRVLATIEAVEERLTDDRGLVYRYRAEDGLEGEEGTFLLCTFWLAQALAIAGRVDRARDTFERAASYANDLGLLSEEVDPATGELLGNFPQAFSHIGLVNAAWAITRAEAGQDPRL
ncbi:MAG: glycoside hydrolase family 15 protein [Actinobacteria bacterium]|nr:glycoside hydrolase family 15 protein [Actinomycetota bacterium]